MTRTGLRMCYTVTVSLNADADSASPFQTTFGRYTLNPSTVLYPQESGMATSTNDDNDDDDDDEDIKKDPMDVDSEADATGGAKTASKAAKQAAKSVALQLQEKHCTLQSEADVVLMWDGEK